MALTKILTSGLADNAATAAIVAAGAVVQVASVSTSTYQAHNAAIPYLTAPTTSDGLLFLTIPPFTLRQASNQVLVRLQVPLATTNLAGGTVGFTVFRGTTLIGGTYSTNLALNTLASLGIEALDLPGTVGPHTYTARFGPIASSFYAYLGGQSTGAWASSLLKTTLTLLEIKA